MSASGLELCRVNGQLAMGSTSGLPFPAPGAGVGVGESKNRLLVSARSLPSPDAVIGCLPCGQQRWIDRAACLCVGDGGENGLQSLTHSSKPAACLCVKIKRVVFALLLGGRAILGGALAGESSGKQTATGRRVCREESRCVTC